MDRITIAAAVKKLESTRDKKGHQAGIGPDGSYVLYKKNDKMIQQRKDTIAKRNKKIKNRQRNIDVHTARGYKHTDSTDEPFKKGDSQPLKKQTAAEIKEAAGRKNKANAKASAEARAEKAKAEKVKAKAARVKANAAKGKARRKALNRAVEDDGAGVWPPGDKRRPPPF